MERPSKRFALLVTAVLATVPITVPAAAQVVEAKLRVDGMT